METNEEVQKRIERLSLLSPSARRILLKEQTAIAVDQMELDPDSIRQTMFIALVNDLSEVGICFSSSLAEAYGETWTNYDALLDVLEYIFPSRLYILLKTDPKLRQRLKLVIEGISDDSLLAAWLESLKIYKPNLSRIDFCLQSMNDTGVYALLLENMSDIVQSENLSTVINSKDEEWDAYKAHLMDEAKRAYDKILTLPYTIGDEKVSLLARRLELQLDKKLSQLENTNMYKFLFMTPPEELSQEGRNFWVKEMYEFSVGNKLMPEYYTVRNLTPSFVDVLGMICMAFGMYPTVKGYLSHCEEIKKSFPFLTEDFDDTVDTLAHIKDTDHVV